MTGNQGINATRIACLSAPVDPNDVVRLTDLNSLSATISHHSLINLTNYDDHPQYWSIPGRPTDILTIPNTTASTTPTTGALVVAGGVGIGGSITCTGMLNIGGEILGTQLSLSGSISTSSTITAYGAISSPNISSLGTISGANMSCSNAPVNPNDVLRLTDISNIYGSFNGVWQDATLGSPMSVSIQYEVFQSRFTLYQRQSLTIEAYYTLSYWLSGVSNPSIVIPTPYLPSAQCIFPILGTPNNTTPGNTVMALIISTTGTISFEKLDGTTFTSSTSPVNYITMNPWTATWYFK